MWQKISLSSAWSASTSRPIRMPLPGNPAEAKPHSRMRGHGIVHTNKIHRRENAACQDTIAESRSKALDLSLQPPEHVYPRAIGNVAICPCGVLTLRGAR